MKRTVLKQSLNSLNLFLVAAFLLMALYSAIGQQVFPYIGQYRQNLEQFLSEQLNSQVDIRSLSGDMNVLVPSIQMEGITIAGKSARQANLSIASIDAVLNPRLSLINLKPVFDRVRLSGLYLSLGDGEPTDSQNNPVGLKSLIQNLLLQQYLELNNVTVDFGDGRTVELDHVVMTGDGFHRLMTGSVVYGEEKSIRASLQLYSEGDPWDLSQFYARGNLDVANADVAYWLKNLFDLSTFESFSPSMNLGFEFKEGLLNYAKFNVSSPRVEMQDYANLKAVNTQFWVKQLSLNSWSIWFDKAKFNLKQEPWQFENFGLNLSRKGQDNRWQYYIQDIELSYLENLLYDLELMPETLDETLDSLRPQGNLRDANLIVNQSPSKETQYNFVARLNDIQLNPYKGAPGIKHVSGVVAANKDGGRVQFESDGAQFNFANIYEQALASTTSKGQVDWRIDQKSIRVTSQDLNIQLADLGRVSGGFDLLLNKASPANDQLLLNLALSNVPVAAHKRLVPKIAGENLTNWLDGALLGGTIQNGQLLLLSELQESDSQLQLELLLNAREGRLRYMDEWPSVQDIHGSVWVQNSKVLGRFEQGQSLGGELSNVSLSYDAEENWLAISSGVKGDSEELLAYFQDTPLKKVVNEQLQDWSITGQHETQLGLFIPLDEGEPIVDVATQIKQSDLSLQGLIFEQTAGSIYYSSSQGLSSNSIDTRLWQEDVRLNIVSDVSESGFSPEIRFDGTANMKGLKQWLSLSLLTPIEGRTNVSGSFYINRLQDGFTGIELSSQLKGLKVDAPKPYGKVENDEKPLKLSYRLNDRQEFRLSYADKLSLAMLLKDQSIFSGQVYLGATEAYIPTSQGLLVEGHLSHIPLDQWQQTWRSIDSASSNDTQVQANASFIKEIKVSTDRLSYKDDHVKDVQASIRPQAKGWRLDVTSPIITGRIDYESDQPLNLDLDYIHWPATVNSEKIDLEPQEDLFTNIDPKQVPALRLSVDEIFVGPTNYGSWSLDLDSDGQQIFINNIDGFIKKLSVKGSAQWQKARANQPPLTSVDLRLASNDVAGIQAAWRTKPVMDADSADAQLIVNWQGSPLQFNNETLNGSTTIRLRDGLFMETGDTGALNAFGILNFAAIGRRLRLDFSDLYQSGIHFDSVDVKANIDNGLIRIVDTLDINGPAADFSASGTVNLNTKELNQQLSVTFPVTSSLPFVAILAGFAPPVAASLFFGEKIVGDEIEKFTSATYDVKGTWDKPKLSLRKRFDNEIEGKQDKGFWFRMKRFFGLGDE
ncbi:TIGR02099 family protein [Bermanella marisrubri]|uniref:YhdP central domain-containing protein n=1 Tax=Bermanella marisrubri TaxID=207949 RepID=Q1MYL9_9GAMM|nr:YhdP family protein [Bermanella marisrubri]EAT11097.1 hypothetical protein RED65_07659 [Oceanobacter sp. RED65] [Bermanella marisrubri]QIZ83403.1 TIGR02099 family protein [Bermanella marisrubri]